MENVNNLVKFRWGQIKEIITKEFIFVHLMLFIPSSVAMSFFVIFPYLFDNKLNAPEQIPVALFINGLMTVALQSSFSKHINLSKQQLIWISPLLAVGIILPGNQFLQDTLNIVIDNIEQRRIDGGVFNLTGPTTLNQALEGKEVNSRRDKITCAQGTFTNEHFQYMDKKRGKWNHAKNEDLLK